MKHLIVSADDFGLTKSVNAGIVKAHKEGIVTSLNLIPTGDAFEDALRIVRETGLKEAGVHLSLTETSPLTDPAKIPTLVDKKGVFNKHYYQFLFKFLLKRIDIDHIYIELRSQLEKVLAAGLRLTNLSSHEHLHMIPAILKIFIELAGQYKIPCIRYPYGERPIWRPGIKEIYRRIILTWFEKGLGKALKAQGLTCTDNLIGFLYSGNLDEEILMKMIKSLPDGVTELVCHPGFLGPQVLDRYKFHMNCEEELYGLTSRRVKDLINKEGVKLIPYPERSLVGH
ncbi:MAG: ChbG/HpnK family deacetylase [Candidatus Omnitrophica bacterium]|nr:ChbG/HpnK family deacetylase [Candidatus Omnitrophota bacterium]